MKQDTTKMRRVFYFSILAVALIAIGVVTTVALASGSKVSASTQNQTDSQNNKPQQSSVIKDSSEIEDPKPKPETPVVETITFTMPVFDGTLIKDYTDGTIVFNQTLGTYTGHLGMDVAGAEGAEVMAVYKGTVESITTSYLEGTTITIDHGNNLKTVYNSVESLETLSVGDAVEQGDVIGYVSTTNKQEYKDGAHVHFEVWENGQNISPVKYLEVDEK